MKKYLLLVIYVGFVLVVAGATAQSEMKRASIAGQEVQVFVSVPPLMYIVKSILTEDVAVHALVKENSNAENYEPTFQQMKSIEDASVFFAIGLPYEKKIVDYIEEKKLPTQVVFLGRRYYIDEDTTEAHEGDEVSEEEDDHGHLDGNPHIWMSIDMAFQIAEDARDALQELFPDRRTQIVENYARLAEDFGLARDYIANALAPYRGRGFVIYHPVLDYYANEYGLTQIPIQIKGQEGSIKHIKDIEARAKWLGVGVVFIQEGFPDKTARALAKEIDAQVRTISPLEEDFVLTLKNVTRMLVEDYESRQ